MAKSTFGRVKTWGAETLEPVDLNAEFDNIINNVTSDNFWKAGNIDETDDYTWSGTTAFTGTVTAGVDDTGVDVQFFGASAGAYLLWDESADTLDIRGATAAGPGAISLETAETTVVDGDILGRVDFSAPAEASGTDAILVGASIWAEADDTFSSSNNDTDLVFAVAESEAAAERMRLSYNGTAASLALVGATTMTLSDGSITDSSGAISFENENLTSTGVITGATVEATGGISAGDNAAMGYDSSAGLLLTGQGSLSDITVRNDSGTPIISIPTGTKTVGINTTAADHNLVVANSGTSTQARLSIKGYNDETGFTPIFLIQKSHTDTVDMLVETVDNTILGRFDVSGINSSSSSARGSRLTWTQDGSAGATFVPCTLEMATSSSSAFNTNQILLHADGGVTMAGLLAAAASTDLNINGSDELHSVTSSQVYKKDYDYNINPSALLDLKPCWFTWRTPTDAPVGWPQEVGDAERRDFGLIANEVHTTFPDLVNMREVKTEVVDAEGETTLEGTGVFEPYSVRYNMLSVLLLKYVQGIEARLTALEA